MKSRLRIAIYASNTVPFHGGTLKERPLGGTETGVIRLAEALHARGHEVTVYTPHDNPPPSEPIYKPHAAIQSAQPVDAFVAIRDWIPLLYPVNARLRFLWTGDSYDQFSNFGLGDRRVASKLDRLLTVSEWHSNELCARSGFPREKAFVLGNGIDLSLFERKDISKSPYRLMYSSTPHRGLVFVPQLLTELRKKYPEAECHIFSSYQVYDQQGIRDFSELRNLLEKTPGCVLHGSVKQDELAAEFLKSRILFYPCHYEETFCITALEAQAAGCVPVTTALAALPETVGDGGLLIEGNPTTLEYQRAYLAACEKVISDESLFEKLAARGRERAGARTWSKVAERFESLFS